MIPTDSSFLAEPEIMQKIVAKKLTDDEFVFQICDIAACRVNMYKIVELFVLSENRVERFFSKSQNQYIARVVNNSYIFANVKVYWFNRTLNEILY